MEDTGTFSAASDLHVLIAVFAVRKHLTLLLLRNVGFLKPFLSYEEAGGGSGWVWVTFYPLC